MSDGKAKAAIDALLEGKSDAFRATVLELARQLNWDEDDPAFLVAIATNQLEALIKQYPDKITAAMERAASTLEADWQQLQAKLAVSALKSVQTASQITAKLTDTQLLIDQMLSRAEQVMKAEREATLQVMATERDEARRFLADERKAVEQQAQALAEQQKQVIEAKTTELIAQGIASSQKQADKQVKAIVSGVRKKHYAEAVAIACLCAATLVFTSWTTAWVSRGRAEDSSRWGDLERWNQEELQACDAVGRATCNIHIKVPKEE